MMTKTIVLGLVLFCAAFALAGSQAEKDLELARLRDLPTTYSAPAFQFGNYSEYHEGWSSPYPDDLLVTFEVKAPYGDVRIGLSPKLGQKSCRDEGTCFEVVLGSDGNKFIDINNESFVWAPISNGNMCGPEFTPFWVQLRDDELVVGYGLVPYRNVVAAIPKSMIMKVYGFGKEPISWMSGLRYVAFSSWEEAFEVRNIKVGRSVTPRQTKSIRPFVVRNSAFLYEQYLPYRVDPDEFELLFDAQGLGGLMIGFLPDRVFYSEETNAYEIVLGTNYDAGSVMRHGTGGAGHTLDAFLDKHTRVFSASRFTPFWIRNSKGIMSVGFGRVAGENVLMTSDPHGQIPKLKDVELAEIALGSEAFATAVRIVAVQSNGKWLFDARHEDTPEDILDVNDAPTLTMDTRKDEVFVPYIQPKHPQSCPPMELCYSKQPHQFVMHDVPSRYQWWTDGAYCGEVASQSAAMYYGVYLSQAAVRKIATPHGFGQFFSSPTGNELMHTNMPPTLDLLGFNVEAWDFAHASFPQAPGYLRWVKKHLLAGHPVLWYLLVGAGPFYDHIQSVFGYSSDHPLSDPNVYDTDMIGATTGYDLMRRWRPANSLYDTSQMGTRYAFNGENNNCTRGWHTECLPYNQTWGVAMIGLKDPLKRSIPTSVSVDDAGMEAMSRVAQLITATVHVRGPLMTGRLYRILRWDSSASFPRDSMYESSDYTHAHTFVASGPQYKWVDPIQFLSTSAIYYVTVVVDNYNLNGHVVRETLTVQERAEAQ